MNFHCGYSPKRFVVIWQFYNKPTVEETAFQTKVLGLIVDRFKLRMKDWTPYDKVKIV